MRGDSGKNISLQGIAKHPDADETAKAHIHITIRCELTAVFLYTIFFLAILEESRKLSLYLLYFEVQR